jgi:hypothetical protein
MSIEAPIEPSSGHRTLLADGTVVLVRRLDPADREAVLRLHTELPLDDRYLRFPAAARRGRFHGTGPPRVAPHDGLLGGADAP